MNPRRRQIVSLVLAGLGPLWARAANPQPTDDPQASPSWKWAREQLFGSRPIEAASNAVLALDVPSRAVDAAVVPLAIRAQAPGSAMVKRLVLVIDANPSPIAAVIDLDADLQRAEIETRVRVDGYSFVRAVAEFSDGRLVQALRFVKASGGCSAPPGTDPQTALATLGRMAFRVDGNPAGNEPLMVQLAIQHPNHSGMAMDQATRQYTPAHFVRKIDVSTGHRRVLSAEVNFSISENPMLRFRFLPRGATELRVQIEDSQGLKFSAVHALAGGSS